MWPVSLCGSPAVRLVRIAAVHHHAPSIDKGVTALLWAAGLSLYIYFGLLAIGENGAFTIVITLVSFAAIWLFVRTRGDAV